MLAPAYPSYHCASFGNYITWSNTELARRTNKIKSSLKAGKTRVTESMLARYDEQLQDFLFEFLNRDVTLVPVPRSHPLRDNGLWPAKIIADVIHNKGYAKQVINALERHTAIRSASGCKTSDERPTIDEHKSTMQVNHEIIDTDDITIIDDIITQGRTTCACYELLKQAYPDKNIRIFAVLKTVHNPDGDKEEKLIEPTISQIARYPSGRSFRNDVSVFDNL